MNFNFRAFSVKASPKISAPKISTPKISTSIFGFQRSFSVSSYFKAMPGQRHPIVPPQPPGTNNPTAEMKAQLKKLGDQDDIVGMRAYVDELMNKNVYLDEDIYNIVRDVYNRKFKY